MPLENGTLYGWGWSSIKRCKRIFPWRPLRASSEPQNLNSLSPKQKQLTFNWILGFWIDGTNRAISVINKRYSQVKRKYSPVLRIPRGIHHPNRWSTAPLWPVDDPYVTTKNNSQWVLQKSCWRRKDEVFGVGVGLGHVHNDQEQRCTLACMLFIPDWNLQRETGFHSSISTQTLVVYK